MHSRLWPLFLSLISCGGIDSGARCQQGDEDCPCFDDLTCKTGFVCVVDECKSIEDQSSNDSGNTTSSGGTGTSSSAGSTSTTGSGDTGSSSTEIPAGSTSGNTGTTSGTSSVTTTGDSSSETGEESCDPFSTRCFDTKHIQSCNAQGQWDPPQICDGQACVQGQCTGECAPDTTECLDPKHMRTCNEMGLWGSPIACVNTTCIGTSCTGECDQGQTRCQGDTVQRCNAVGLWVDDVDCNTPKEICDDGTCVSACKPWVKQFGTSKGDFGEGIAVDASGNVFVAGHTYGSFDRQPQADKSDSDIFIAKYNPAGNEIWTKQLGTSQWDRSQGTAVDASGNAFIAGWTDGTFNEQTSAGDRDIFVAKISPSGAKLWEKQLGTSGPDTSSGVAVDATGNAVFSGWTKGTLTGQTSAGSNDVFVAKYSPSGEESWVRQFGTSGDDLGHGIAIDASGNSFITGQTKGTFTGRASAVDTDIFIAKYDPLGEGWVRQFGTSELERAFGVAVDASGNALITGHTHGTFDKQTSVGKQDIFVAKYNPSGTMIWTRQFGTSGEDDGQGVAVDASGNIFITGWTKGTLTGQTTLGESDIVIAKYSPAGNIIWTKQFGTSDHDYGKGISVDSIGRITVAGNTKGTFKGQASTGDEDIFIARICDEDRY